ncbi:MAG: hypothetical protein JSV74_03455 [Dehalococcoidia bacterium]|nr:MAG: hypothetical protein JSV74_03455 [Dehalococcoidia bacterium]
MVKTSTGLEDNIAALLCYVGWWVSGLIFFLIESENKFVRFHAVQSIVIFGIINIMLIIFGWIPILNLFMGFLVGGLAFVLWIVLMYKSYQGVIYKLPLAGDLAEKWANK